MGKPKLAKERPLRTVLNLNGRIELCRTRWYAKGEGSDSPLDRLIDKLESSVSVGVRELCCRLGIAGGSFARSADNIDRAAHIKMSEEQYRTLVESDGKAVLAAARMEQLEIDWSASQCKAKTPDGQDVSRVYISADGVMVPVTTTAEKLKRRQTVLKKRREKPAKAGQKRPGLPAVKAGSDQRYKQMYLTAFYDQKQERRLVSVTRQDHHGLGKLLKRDAAALRLKAAEEKVGIVDGAVCLRNHLEDLPLTAIGLDFYHLSEHVHAARRGTFGEESAEGKTWATQVLHTVRHEGYEPFWDQLQEWRKAQRRGPKRDCADELLHYVAQRKQMIDYPRFEKQGWNIGSGPIESMCKATTRRIKGPGMRWDRDNAEGMMALEALYQSNLWDRYWQKAMCHQN
jgi:hypothetical protein